MDLASGWLWGKGPTSPLTESKHDLFLFSFVTLTSLLALGYQGAVGARRCVQELGHGTISGPTIAPVLVDSYTRWLIRLGLDGPDPRTCVQAPHSPLFPFLFSA